MKSKLLLLLAIVFYTNIFAQLNFQDHVVIDDTYSTYGASSVYAADLDGDGDMDMLSTSQEDHKVAWYENMDGQGNFGRQQIISIDAKGARLVYAADIDGDGDMDVISVSSYWGSWGDKIAWYENLDGQGTFGPLQTIASIYARSIYIVDMDGDSDMDVLAIRLYDAKIVWYENTDGQGTFGLERIILTNEVATEYEYNYGMSVYAKDLDSDGDMDVLFTAENTYDRYVVWLENTDGQENFGSPQLISTDVGLRSSVSAADMDGDGDVDILSSSQYKLVWYENMGEQEGFSEEHIITYSSDGHFYLVDMDGDDDMDILFGDYYDVSWCENIDGQGNFGEPEIITYNLYMVKSVYAADLDGDGDMDALSASFGDNKIAWYENETSWTQHIQTANADWATSVHAADIDGDGDMDILSASFSDNKIAWYENVDGQGNFGTQQVIIEGLLYMEENGAEGARDVYAADLDGDGDMDVLSASWKDNRIAWYENLDGQGDFGFRRTISINAARANAVHSADLDGDGDMDVLSAAFVGDEIAWYENTDGQGTFGDQQIITSNANGANDVYASDIDGDGDMDVLSASLLSDEIAWYENTDGEGSFGAKQIITTNADGARAVHATDIDGDGDLDVLSASQKDNKIAWYENIDGLGSFGAQQIITTEANQAKSVYAADMDGDGDIDVLSGSQLDGKVAWYKNVDGQGFFRKQQIISTNADFVESIYAADIDGDGDIDVLSASQKDDKIAWYENLNSVATSEITLLNFSVHPTPTLGTLTIISKTNITQIEIYNSVGKQVLSNSNQAKIDISSLNQGLYFCKVKDENGDIGIKKIVKQ